MKKSLIPLVVAVFLSCNLDAFSQQGPPGGGKGGGGGGKGGGGGGKGGPPGGGGGKGGPPGGGQKGGPQSGGGSSGRLLGSSSYPQVDRTRTPLEQIKSALSLIRLKRELRHEHYDKLSSSLAAAANVSTPSVPLDKLSRSVADLVSRHRLGYFESRDLAAVLHDAVLPQRSSAERIEMTVKSARAAFRKTEVTPEELAGIEKSLRAYTLQAGRIGPH